MKDKLFNILNLLGLTETLILSFISKYGAKGLAAIIKKTSTDQDDRAVIIFAKQLLEELDNEDS